MKDAPRLAGAKAAERAAREDRLAQALRDNLRRRKAQARAKEEAGERQRPDREGERSA